MKNGRYFKKKCRDRQSLYYNFSQYIKRLEILKACIFYLICTSMACNLPAFMQTNYKTMNVYFNGYFISL